MGVKTGYLKVINAVKHVLTGRLEHWQDPRVVYVNGVEHHAPLRLLEDTKDAFAALSAARGETEWVKFVARAEAPTNCRFRLFSNPASCPVDQVTAPSTAEEDGFADWDETEIPSNWQFKYPEVDPPIYTNITFPWKRLTPLTTSVPKADNPTGCYRIEFSVPASWVSALDKGERDVFLILHGAGAGVDIFVNGAHVGYGQDSMTETEVKISDANLREGQNLLTLIVYRWTDGSYMEDQDQWWLSGVFRDVELSCRPRHGGIVDYLVETSLTEQGAGGSVTVHVKTNDSPETMERGTVIRASLFDAEERLVASSAAQVALCAEFGNETLAQPAFCATAALRVENPTLWGVERPYLYTLVVEAVEGTVDAVLAGGASAVVRQIEATRVGIRTVEIVDAQVRVNGEPILVCGINRHEWEPESGKVMHEAQMIKDIKLLKQFNFNAVRNCHYPSVHRWYELCDEYGLFLIDEANIETHGFAKVAHLSLLQCDSHWAGAFMARVQACVRRSRNHPSIIGWSLGNESGCGPNMRACADWVRQVDPTRTLQYEGGIHGGDSPMLMGDGCDPHCTDIVCPMYDSPLLMAKIHQQTTAASGSDRARPMILCEYAHAMGNSSGNLHLYWKLFRSKAHPKMQGGFIWDFADQGLSLPGFANGAWGYGGDFGPTSGREDKTFCINGMVLPDRTPHPAMHEAKFLMQPVEFAFDYESQGGDASFEMQLEFYPHAPLVEQVAFEYVVFGVASADPAASGPCKLSVVDAGARTYSLVLEQARAKSSEVATSTGLATLQVRMVLATDLPYAPKGHLVASQSFALDPNPLSKVRASYEDAEKLAMANTSPIKTTNLDGGRLLRLEGKTYVVDFDIASGAVASMSSSGGEELVLAAHGLKHCFFRAPTDNDLGGLDSMLPNKLLKPFVSRSQTSFNGHWRNLGLDALVPLTTKVSIDRDNEKTGSVVIRVHEDHKYRGALRFATETLYKFCAESVLLDVTVTAAPATQKGTQSLPRVGMELVLPGEYDQVEYLGRGPYENYPDRKAGTRVGVFSTRVDDMHFPYVMPSESGGRADTQWVRMRSPTSNRALKVTYMFPEDDEVRAEFFDGMDLSKRSPGPAARPSDMCGAQFSATRYAVADIDVAQHQYELPLADETTPIHVHIDTAFMGLGGDVSWMPKTHKQYLVNAKTWRYKLQLEVERNP